MKFILGQKQEMTQIFQEDSGDVMPVTRISAGPCPVIRVKRADAKDGYNAVAIGLVGKKKMGKRDLGQAKGLGNLQYIKEFRLTEPITIDADTSIKVDTFIVGDKINIVGISKGKGFQGVVKRHGFHGQQATHGTKDQERAPGSIGPTEPARVFPGMRMPGHMGAQQVTVKNLKVVKIDLDRNEIYVKGAVPGSRGSLLMMSGQGELKLTKTIKKEIKVEKEVLHKEGDDKKETVTVKITEKKAGTEHDKK